MALVLADRVVEQTTTQGTNSFELIGTADGYQAFSVVGNGSTVYYTAEGVRDDGTLTGEWEVGVGVYNAGILSRDTILSSSTGSKVSFTAGQKNVFIDLPSEKAVVLDDADKVSGYAITGGSINNTSIGATTPNTGRFTSVTTPSVTATTNDLTLSAISTGSVIVNQGANGATGLVLSNSALSTASARLFFQNSNGTTSISNLTGNTIEFRTNATIGSTSGVEQFRVANTASAVNYVQVTGAATGGFPSYSAQGSDSNVGLYYTVKGFGSHRFTANGGGASEQFRIITNSASTVNFLQVVGSATNLEPIMSVQGTDTNISMGLQSKGTGAIDLAAGSSGVNISNGQTVTAITRTSAGSLYTSVPIVTISAPTTAGGVQATAQARVFVWSNPITTAGTGYTVGNTLTAIGGTGTAYSFTVTSIDGSGGITGVNIVNFGDYTVVPTNPVTFSGGTGTGFTSNMTWTVGSTFTITNAGSGYIEQPTVSFSGGGGSGASAYATVGSAVTVKGLHGTLNFATSGGTNFAVLDSGQNPPAAYPYATGGSTSAGYGVAGSATNAGFTFTSKGTSAVDFYTNSYAQLQLKVSHTASAVNYVQVTGSATGANPTISAQGSDTNINFSVQSKGSSTINLQNDATAANFGVELGTNTTVNKSIYLDFHASSGTDYDYRLIRNSGVNGVVDYVNAGTGTHRFFTGTSAPQFYVSHTASAVNYVQVTGAATTGAPTISAQGSDANININLQAKGSGQVRSVGWMSVGVGAANYWQLASAGAGSSPVLSVVGTDTNIDLALTPKGTGLVRFGTYTNTVSTIAGYIEIRDAGGTIRRLAVVS
jgi:hypothetical protein